MDKKQSKTSTDFFGTFLTKKGPKAGSDFTSDIDINIEKELLDAIAQSDGGIDIKSLIMKLSTSASITIMTLKKLEEAGLLKMQDNGTDELAVLTEMGTKLAS
ncbi:MAG: hypothetical protein WBM93_06040 [Parasphingorhabdus sp.]